MVQFAWYLVVGGTSLLAALALLSTLLRLGAQLVPAFVAGFVVGALVNYVLSLCLTFVERHRRIGEVVRIFGGSLIGLVLTLALVGGFMALDLSATAATIAATPIALVWNYAGRRLFVFTSNMPLRTWQVSQQTLALARSAGLRFLRATPFP
jgi:putative flippase GtrA